MCGTYVQQWTEKRADENILYSVYLDKHEIPTYFTAPNAFTKQTSEFVLDFVCFLRRGSALHS